MSYTFTVVPEHSRRAKPRGCALLAQTRCGHCPSALAPPVMPEWVTTGWKVKNWSLGSQNSATQNQVDFIQTQVSGRQGERSREVCSSANSPAVKVAWFPRLTCVFGVVTLLMQQSTTNPHLLLQNRCMIQLADFLKIELKFT